MSVCAVKSPVRSDDWVRKQMPGGLVVGLPEEMQITVSYILELITAAGC